MAARTSIIKGISREIICLQSQNKLISDFRNNDIIFCMSLYKKLLLSCFVVGSLSLIGASIHAENITPPNPPITSDLYVGLVGEQVSSLQQFLKNLGYFTYPTVTGYFGPFTRAAVVSFQNAYGIQPVGAIGPITRAKIVEISSSTTTSAVTQNKTPVRRRGGSHSSNHNSEPDPSVYTLSVNFTGSGDGFITSTPAGISCSENCDADFAEGTSVSLAVVVAPNATFTGWSGGACSGTGACVVNVTADTVVIANFELITNTLTVELDGEGSGVVTSSPAGIDCGSTCTASFDNITEITLTASSTDGSTFTGWSGGDCSGTSTCVLTMTEDTTVTATFALPEYSISGTVSGLAGSGLVLQNNGGDNLSISGNGAFSFATSLATGESYSVTVLTQPSSPAMTCVVTSGSGTVASSNITNVAVSCVINLSEA